MVDEYERKARIYPALLATLPISVTAVAFGVTSADWWTAVAGLVVASGFWVLIAQIGRHPGKRLQPKLWESWGGAPTTILLRHRGGNNAVRVARLHARLATITGMQFPSQEQEAADPVGADAIYEAAVDELREATRDEKQFSLVFKENCNYGFRRNTLGLRPWAIASCLIAALSPALIVIMDKPEFLNADVGLAVTLIGLDLIAAAAWWRLVNADWVKQTAFAYAERLLESTALLSE